MYWSKICTQASNQVAAETNVVTQESATSTNDSESQQPQTLYVAIQPGAESGQGEQPAVYLEVVEAGSGTEVTSSDGQVNLVQEEMVIDNGEQHVFCKNALFILCIFPENVHNRTSYPYM